MEFWVGGQKVSGDWRWLTNELVNMHPDWWHPDQPSGGTECLMIWERIGFDDTSCSETKEYVCEF